MAIWMQVHSVYILAYIYVQVLVLLAHVACYYIIHIRLQTNTNEGGYTT
jgi:hypothetical protein